MSHVAHWMVSIARQLNLRQRLQVVGVDVRHYSQTTDPYRQKLLSRLDVTLVLDIGANVGQWGARVRRLGYEGRMVSFEPLPDAYRTLQSQCMNDKRWSCLNVAIGSHDGQSMIHETINSVSSSLLPMLDRHRRAAPESYVIGSHKVEMRALDGLMKDLSDPSDRVYLKADVQGFESEVLDGASATLDQCVAVELETSLVPLYEGQALWLDVIERMGRTGFRTCWLHRGFIDPSTGNLLQCDVILAREQRERDLSSG